ncbi:anaphase promoting complex subunit cdc16 [Mortierella sp. GBA30]|nr:anaphase promoting complex subunit cdc16 [Mortierella sp. GBA30]
MPSTPTRRRGHSRSHRDTTIPVGGQGSNNNNQAQVDIQSSQGSQGSQGSGYYGQSQGRHRQQSQPNSFQTPNNNNNNSNNNTGHPNRTPRSTRSTTASGVANTPGTSGTTPGQGTWSTNNSPNGNFTTPTRPSRQHGHNNRNSLGGGGGGPVSGGGGGDNSGSASSSNSTSRQLRGPPLPNPQVSLRRATGSSGSLQGPGSNNNSFSAQLASFSDLSPVGNGSGSRTPNALSRISQSASAGHYHHYNQATSAANQSMRVIPSPFANSPAGWLETSFVSSPVKGLGIMSASKSVGGKSLSMAPGSASIFGGISVPGSTGSGAHMPSGSGGVGIGGGSLAEQVGYDSNRSSMNAVDFFAPAEVNRDRNTVDSMRAWRTDAMHQHMYRTAAYWGDKVLSITDDSNDVFWLSQVYYLMGEYRRAINLLQRQNLLESSVACRFLAIQCMIRTEKWQEALEYLGEVNQFVTRDDASDASTSNADGGVKLEASMCHLRGIVFKNMNNIVRAKECFKEALQVDVKCYDALDSLVSNNMLTTSEERELIDGLEFNKQLFGQDADFVKMLYTSKLKKYDHIDEQEEIYSTLSAKFLTENADLLYAKAEIYFTQCRFDKCLDCTKRILQMDKYNLACIPMHLVSLYELDQKNELFFIAHELVNQHPKHAVAWFAVGVYYYLIGNLGEARRYFGKSSTIDRHYGPAWIGFGHSFALEGEHDQAISAYATSSKLFQGSHLGSLYLGMQHLQQNNVPLAQKYLISCLAICDSDPLLLNEIGVMYYNLGQYEDAVQYLLKVVEKLERSQRKNIIWETTFLNLAHAYRKLKKYSEAEIYFLKVDAITNLGPAKASALVGLGFIYQIMGQLSDAIESYHKVLAIRPSDQIAKEMLQKVMEDKVRISEMEWMDVYLPEELRDDVEVERKVKALEERRARTARALQEPWENVGEAKSSISSSSSSTLLTTTMAAKRKASFGTSGRGGDIKGKMRKEDVDEEEKEENVLEDNIMDEDL